MTGVATVLKIVGGGARRRLRSAVSAADGR